MLEKKCSLLLFIIPVLYISSPANANIQEVHSCMQDEVIKGIKENLTIAKLRDKCESIIDREDKLYEKQVADKQFFKLYKKNYITAGVMWNDDGTKPFSGQTADLKFELGFKYQIFKAEKYKFLKAFYAGYSQRSWWDVAEESLPFAETNYNPEFFLDFDNKFFSKDLNYQFGIEHQSNGRDGLESRSWNTVYFQGEIKASDNLNFGLKIWEPFEVSAENGDITDFLGNVRINAGLRLWDRLKLDLSAVKGHDVSTISYQVDLTYNMIRQFNASLFVTYYNGYGEALISYNKKTESLRAGLSIMFE